MRGTARIPLRCRAVDRQPLHCRLQMAQANLIEKKDFFWLFLKSLQFLLAGDRLCRLPSLIKIEIQSKTKSLKLSQFTIHTVKFTVWIHFVNRKKAWQAGIPCWWLTGTKLFCCWLALIAAFLLQLWMYLHGKNESQLNKNLWSRISGSDFLN